MNCPSCGAPLRLDRNEEDLPCDFCKGIYHPEINDEGVRVLGEPAAESCPVCAVPLMNTVVAQEPIRYCTQCRGMLIPMANFVAVVEGMKYKMPGRLLPHPPDRAELERRIDCPQCHRPMDTHYYGGPGNVVIDDCSPCHLNWLDHGELMRIARAPDRTYVEDYGSHDDPLWRHGR